MSPKPVKVSFTPPDPSSWLFDPNPAKMPKHADSVVLTRDPKDAPWAFVRPNGLPSAYTWTVDKDGGRMTIEDPGTPPDVSLPYSITVSVGGTVYDSPATGVAGAPAANASVAAAAGPPPVIVNDGTGGVGGTRPPA
jgi:hypothetical protein